MVVSECVCGVKLGAVITEGGLRLPADMQERHNQLIKPANFPLSLQIGGLFKALGISKGANVNPMRAAAIILFGTMITACETMQVVDRGLHSAAEGVTQRDRVTGRRTLSLQNRAQQIKQGNQWAEQFIEEAKAAGKKLDEEQDAAAYERIQRIFTRLHAISHVREEKWTPVLVQEAAWNAFTTGGTYFVINSGLEEDLKDDSELANVIAHEMAHTVANHVFEGQSFMQLKALSGSNSARRGTFQAAFTHENEAEADRIAVLYCALAGYDPLAGSRIWRRMEATSGNDALFVHDHPMNSERAQQAEHVANLVAKHYTKGKQNPNFATVLANNEIFSYESAEEIKPGKGGGFFAALDAAMTTMKQQQEAKLEEQRQQSRIAFIKAVHQLSTIMESVPVAPNRWRVSVKYRGKLVLTDLAFKLIVHRPIGDPLVITQTVSGVLQPNSTFSVDFESPDLNAYGTDPRNVQLLYDNAKAL